MIYDIGIRKHVTRKLMTSRDTVVIIKILIIYSC